MRKRLMVILLAAVVIIAGCKAMKFQASDESAPMAGEAAPAPMMMDPARSKMAVADGMAYASVAEQEPGAPPAATDKPNSQAIKPKIIRTGSAVLRSTDLEADIKKVEDKVKTINGYVAASTQDTANELNKTANLTVKIPAEHFDGFMAFLKTAFKKEQITTSSEDVSEEYVDVESRLNNFRLEEKRLLELLENRTGKLSDVLEVERELSRVREEIERMTGRLRYLDNRVGLSTITITLIQSKQIETVEASWSARFWHDVKQTFLDGLSILGRTLRAVFLLVVGLSPVWVIAGIVAWVVIRRRKRKAA